MFQKTRTPFIVIYTLTHVSSIYYDKYGPCFLKGLYLILNDHYLNIYMTSLFCFRGIIDIMYKMVPKVRKGLP